MKLVGIDCSYRNVDRIYEVGYSVLHDDIQVTGRIRGNKSEATERGISPKFLTTLLKMVRDDIDEDVVLLTWGGPEYHSISKQAAKLKLKRVTVVDLCIALDPFLVTNNLREVKTLLGIQLDKTKDTVTDAEIILEVAKHVIEVRNELLYILNPIHIRECISKTIDMKKVSPMLAKRGALFGNFYRTLVTSTNQMYKASTRSASEMHSQRLRELIEQGHMQGDRYINPYSLLSYARRELNANSNYVPNIVETALDKLQVLLVPKFKLSQSKSDYQHMAYKSQVLKQVWTQEYTQMYSTVYLMRYQKCNSMEDYRLIKSGGILK